MSAGLSAGERAAARRYAQPRLSLGGRAVSPEAKALVSYCLNEIVLPSLPGQRKRPTSVPAIERATEGLLAGLVAAWGDHDGWRRRPLAASSFTGEGVSRGQFLKVYSALEVAGLVQTLPFHFDRSGPAPRGTETRLRLSETGRALVASYGIGEGDSGHFLGPEASQGT